MIQAASPFSVPEYLAFLTIPSMLFDGDLSRSPILWGMDSRQRLDLSAILLLISYSIRFWMVCQQLIIKVRPSMSLLFYL